MYTSEQVRHLISEVTHLAPAYLQLAAQNMNIDIGHHTSHGEITVTLV